MQTSFHRWIFYIGMLLVIPYILTMIMTGVTGRENLEETFQSGIQIQVGEGELQEEIDLEDYVIGVMASQIPADYEIEALKGQAVIQRTNILNEMEREKTTSAKDLPFSYLSLDNMKEQWGEKNWEDYYARLKSATSQTKGIYMTYDGEYIEAYYHAVSIGTTVSAKELIGKEIAYLQSVDSNQDVESKDYMSIQSFSYEDVKKVLLEHEITVTEEEIKNNLKIETKTKLGYVTLLSIGKKEIKGEEWQEWFSLPSTNFYFEDYEGKLRIISLGKGRGLGLSQYGANELAKTGVTYQEILEHYYQEITLNKITESGNDITRGDENEEK